jgi:hypothetical protein
MRRGSGRTCCACSSCWRSCIAFWFPASRSARAGVASRMGGLVCLALALLSKETALAAPLLLGALMVLFPAAFPAERGARCRGLAASGGLAAGFFALWAVLPTELQAAGGAWNGESLRFPETVFSMPALWTRTLRLLLVPWPLNVTPGFEPVVSAVSLRFAAGVGWLAVCGWGAWAARRAAPEMSLGLLWMLVFFLPVSNLWPLLHPVADRYLYPIAPGFAVLAAWVIAHQRAGAGVRAGRAGGDLCAAAGLARRAMGIGREKLVDGGLFPESEERGGGDVAGLLREEAGDAEGAAAFYQAAVEANPQAERRGGTGAFWKAGAGIWAESERLLRRVVEMRPEGAKGWHDLSVCLERQGRRTEAAEAAARAPRRYGSAKPWRANAARAGSDARNSRNAIACRRRGGSSRTAAEMCCGSGDDALLRPARWRAGRGCCA